MILQQLHEKLERGNYPPLEKATIKAAVESSFQSLAHREDNGMVRDDLRNATAGDKLFRLQCFIDFVICMFLCGQKEKKNIPQEFMLLGTRTVMSLETLKPMEEIFMKLYTESKIDDGGNIFITNDLEVWGQVADQCLSQVIETIIEEGGADTAQIHHFPVSKGHIAAAAKRGSLSDIFFFAVAVVVVLFKLCYTFVMVERFFIVCKDSRRRNGGGIITLDMHPYVDAADSGEDGHDYKNLLHKRLVNTSLRFLLSMGVINFMTCSAKIRHSVQMALAALVTRNTPRMVIGTTSYLQGCANTVDIYVPVKAAVQTMQGNRETPVLPIDAENRTPAYWDSLLLELTTPSGVSAPLAADMKKKEIAAFLNSRNFLKDAILYSYSNHLSTRQWKTKARSLCVRLLKFMLLLNRPVSDESYVSLLTVSQGLTIDEEELSGTILKVYKERLAYNGLLTLFERFRNTHMCKEPLEMRGQSVKNLPIHQQMHIFEHSFLTGTYNTCIHTHTSHHFYQHNSTLQFFYFYSYLHFFHTPSIIIIIFTSSNRLTGRKE